LPNGILHDTAVLGNEASKHKKIKHKKYRLQGRKVQSTDFFSTTTFRQVQTVKGLVSWDTKGLECEGNHSLENFKTSFVSAHPLCPYEVENNLTTRTKQLARNVVGLHDKPNTSLGVYFSF
jgi:hypothetical protein